MKKIRTAAAIGLIILAILSFTGCFKIDVQMPEDGNGDHPAAAAPAFVQAADDTFFD